MKVSDIATTDILTAYNISPVRDTDSTGRTNYQCPLHDETKGHSFFVFPDGHWHCFGKCNTGGDAIRFVMLKNNFPYKTAIQEVERLLHVEIEYNSNRHEFAELYKTNEELCALFQEELKKHPKIISYLKNNRGYTEESIKYWRIGYVTRDLLMADPNRYGAYEKVGAMKDNGGRYVPLFRERITYPITDYNNEIVGFSCRVDPYAPKEIKDNVGKYINSSTSPVFSKKENLFGLGARWRELIKELGFCDIVEGANDTTILQQEGIAALGFLGLGSNDISAVKALAIRYPNLKWNLCLDGDDAGYDRAFSLSVNTLFDFIDKNPHIVIRVSFLPQGIDPDEYILQYKKEGFIKNIHNNKRTMSVEDFISRKIISETNKCDSLSEKRAILFSDKGYKKALLSFPKSLRESYWQLIEEKTGVQIKSNLESIESKKMSKKVETKDEEDSNSPEYEIHEITEESESGGKKKKGKTAEDIYKNNYPLLYIVKNNSDIVEIINVLLEKHGFPTISLFSEPKSEVKDPVAFWKSNKRLVLDEYYALFMTKENSNEYIERFHDLYLDVFKKV